jgi:hypothetical protein
MKHLKCKHVCAVLLALFALKNHSKDKKPPDAFKRKNMKRYEGMSDNVRTAVDSSLTWPQVVSNFLIDPDEKRKGRANKDVFLKASKAAAKPKKHPATLESMTVAQLKAILSDLQQPLTGSKADLIARIVLKRPIPPSSAAPTTAKTSKPTNTVTKTKAKTIATTKAPVTKPVANSNAKKRSAEQSELDELRAETNRFIARKKTKR